VVDRKKKEAPEKSTTESRLKGISLKILLAEDNLINQKLAARLLEKQGWQVTIANNGKEAVELSEKGEFDMILMDIQMPEMDGLEATEEIRKREEVTGKHIPIIALTAHAFEEDKKKCLETGMNAYTTKPIRVRELFAIIEDISERFEKNKGGKYEGRDSRTSI
jgi:CheY-like chemotaxis protein